MGNLDETDRATSGIERHGAREAGRGAYGERERLVPLNGDKAEIMRVLRAYHSAMVEARTADLAEMLDDGFSLVHITGYVQPKHEWLGVIRSGRFDYHGIDVDEQSISVRLSGDTAAATGGGLFEQARGHHLTGDA